MFQSLSILWNFSKLKCFQQKGGTVADWSKALPLREKNDENKRLSTGQGNLIKIFLVRSWLPS